MFLWIIHIENGLIESRGLLYGIGFYGLWFNATFNNISVISWRNDGIDIEPYLINQPLKFCWMQMGRAYAMVQKQVWTMYHS